jgi:hypothetical protein
VVPDKLADEKAKELTRIENQEQEKQYAEQDLLFDQRMAAREVLSTNSTLRHNLLMEYADTNNILRQRRLEKEIDQLVVEYEKVVHHVNTALKQTEREKALQKWGEERDRVKERERIKMQRHTERKREREAERERELERVVEGERGRGRGRERQREGETSTLH